MIRFNSKQETSSLLSLCSQVNIYAKNIFFFVINIPKFYVLTNKSSFIKNIKNR